MDIGGEQDPGFTQAQLAQVDLSSALAEERDHEIRKIVESITELAEVRGRGGLSRKECGCIAEAVRVVLQGACIKAGRPLIHACLWITYFAHAASAFALADHARLSDAGRGSRHHLGSHRPQCRRCECVVRVTVSHLHCSCLRTLKGAILIAKCCCCSCLKNCEGCFCVCKMLLTPLSHPFCLCLLYHTRRSA